MQMLEGASDIRRALKEKKKKRKEEISYCVAP